MSAVLDVIAQQLAGKPWPAFVAPLLATVANQGGSLAGLQAQCLDRFLPVAAKAEDEAEAAWFLYSLVTGLRRGDASDTTAARLDTLATEALSKNTAALLGAHWVGAARWGELERLLSHQDDDVVLGALGGICEASLAPVVPALKRLAVDMKREQLAHEAGRTLARHGIVASDWDALRWALTETPEYIMQSVARSIVASKVPGGSLDEDFVLRVLDDIGGKTAPGDFVSFLLANHDAIAPCTRLRARLPSLLQEYEQTRHHSVFWGIHAADPVARLDDEDGTGLQQVTDLLSSEDEAVREGALFAVYMRANDHPLPARLRQALSEGLRRGTLDDSAIETLVLSAACVGDTAGLEEASSLARELEFEDTLFHALSDAIHDDGDPKLVPLLPFLIPRLNDHETREPATEVLLHDARRHPRRVATIAAALRSSPEADSPGVETIVGYLDEIDHHALLGRERWRAYADRCTELGLDEEASYAARRAERQPPLALLFDPLDSMHLPVLPPT